MHCNESIFQQNAINYRKISSENRIERTFIGYFQIISSINNQLNSSKPLIESFNKNIQLRKSLWEDGFFSNVKSLPGLLTQQYELTKLTFANLYELSKLNEGAYLPEYLTYLIFYHSVNSSPWLTHTVFKCSIVRKRLKQPSSQKKTTESRLCNVC